MIEAQTVSVSWSSLSYFVNYNEITEMTLGFRASAASFLFLLRLLPVSPSQAEPQSISFSYEFPFNSGSLIFSPAPFLFAFFLSAQATCLFFFLSDRLVLLFLFSLDQLWSMLSRDVDGIEDIPHSVISTIYWLFAPLWQLAWYGLDMIWIIVGTKYYTLVKVHHRLRTNSKK